MRLDGKYSFFWLMLVSPVAMAAASFDCKKASLPVEVEICAKPHLGNLDGKMANAYQMAKTRLADDPSALAELRGSQKRFISLRNLEFIPQIGNDYDLGAHMEAQLSLLQAISTDQRQGFEGDWKTSEASLWVGSPGKDGMRPVNAHSQTHDSKHWSCEFLGVARLVNGQMIVEGRDQFKKEYAGWRLSLQRQGRMLELESMPPPGAARKGSYSPFCGMNGSLAGNYFAVGALPDNPCAGVAAGACRE